MLRKERHVVPNSEKGGWDSKRENANNHPSILTLKKKLWTGAEKRQNRKSLN